MAGDRELLVNVQVCANVGSLRCSQFITIPNRFEADQGSGLL